MYHKPHSLKFLRQRKSLLRMPLIVLPFLMMFFYLLGGGSKKTTSGQNLFPLGGINTKLPDAHFSPGKDKDKWSMYETLRNDSSKIWEAIKKDPYYNFQDTSIKVRLNTLKIPDSGAEKVLGKLDQIKAVINQPAKPAGLPDPPLSHLQKLFEERKHPPGNDPEMDRLSGMLDKVLAIQHPEMVSDTLYHKSAGHDENFEVRSDTVEPVISEWNNDDRYSNSFFGLTDPKVPEAASQILQASVPEPVSLVSGSTVKLQIKKEILIHNTPIRAGQLIYGIATLSNERIRIHVSSIRTALEILPVSLDVYDLDGLEGIYIPGSITRDVGKQTADQSISSLGLTSVDPSIGAQAASAGIQAAKTLFSRKLKLIKVSIQAGYQVLLKDSHPH